VKAKRREKKKREGLWRVGTSPFYSYSASEKKGCIRKVGHAGENRPPEENRKIGVKDGIPRRQKWYTQREKKIKHCNSEPI